MSSTKSHKKSMEKIPPTNDNAYDWLLVLIVSSIILLRVFVASRIYLDPHEAFYWLMSKHSDFGIQLEPPLVPTLIYLTTLFGKSVLSVRLVSVLTLPLISLMSYKITLDISGRKWVSLLSVIILNSIPIYMIEGIIMMTESIALLFWASTIYCLHMALMSDTRVRWYILGAVIGLDLWATTLIPLVFTSILLFMILSGRKYSSGLGRSLMVMTLLLIPLVYLLIPFDGGFIKHHLVHHVSQSLGFNFNSFTNLLASQIISLTPPLFLALMLGTIYGVYTALKVMDDYPRLLLFCTSALPMSIFYTTSFVIPIAADWMLMAYFSSSILLALLIGKIIECHPRYVIGALGCLSLALIISNYSCWSIIFNIINPSVAPPSSLNSYFLRYYVDPGLITKLDEETGDKSTRTDVLLDNKYDYPIVLFNRYETYATYVIFTRIDASGTHYWSDYTPIYYWAMSISNVSNDIIFVARDQKNAEMIRPYFQSVEYDGKVDVVKGDVILRSYFFYRASNRSEGLIDRLRYGF